MISKVLRSCLSVLAGAPAGAAAGPMPPLHRDREEESRRLPPSKTGNGKVSVVIPCYNAEDFVGATVQSVLEQTYPDVEILVVDDGSTDGSREVIRRFAGRVREIDSGTNRGGSHARNRGAALAVGEFLMFLDSDDVIAPDTLAGLVEAAGQGADSIAFCEWDRLRSRDGGWRAEPADAALPDPDADPLGEWLGMRWLPPCAVLWPRQLFERTGGWDENLTYNDDGDLMMRAFLNGDRLRRAEYGRAHYRDHGAARITVGTDLSSTRRVRSGIRV
ncbi:MAG: glycosyltransferase, partial [Gemmatimonadetes bacterium]|nr:glycosyltransferase [Gemmatimonadota bacterium]